MRVTEWNVLKMIVFRENMGSTLDLPTARKIYGKEIVQGLDPQVARLLAKPVKNDVVDEKIEYLKEKINALMVFSWVKFIGVTGSVAAGTAKDGDDIDLIIVVRNGTAWLYRGLVLLKNLFNGFVRMGEGKNVKNKLCINIIVEERGLTFAPDLFTMHELYHIIPVYRLKYWDRIIGQNPWLSTLSGKTEERKWEQEESSSFFWFLNKIAMHLQVIYMFLLFHKPNVKRIRSNYEDGKIMFYPNDFKPEKMQSFEELYEVRVEQIVRNRAD